MSYTSDNSSQGQHSQSEDTSQNPYTALRSLKNSSIPGGSLSEPLFPHIPRQIEIEDPNKIAPEHSAPLIRLVTNIETTAAKAAPIRVQPPKTMRRNFSPGLRMSIFTIIITVIVGATIGAQHLFHTSIFSVSGAGGTGITTKSAGSQNIYTPAPLDLSHPPPLLYAESAFLMDETNGATLLEKKPYEELPMASTTKLMTAIVALNHADPSTLITITSASVNVDGTGLGVKAGEVYSLHDLLYGMLMPSANDAAEAIAVGVAGSESKFVGWMNETAAAMGLDHTHFMNPHGLDQSGHYSCARDLAVLARAALSIPLIRQITSTLTYTIPASKAHAAHYLENANESEWWYPGADGGKPGWTGGAQFVDILSAARDGHQLIAVYMRGQHNWVTDIRSLLNWGFSDFTWVSPQITEKQHPVIYDSAYDYFQWDTPDYVVALNGEQYYPGSGYLISGPFLTYFTKNGGIAKFGLPEGLVNSAANGAETQQFQNAVITCAMPAGTCQSS